MDFNEDKGSELEDICRVCRSEATSDRPLFYPCICTGSIKYIHEECLVQWLKHCKKEYCELCNHRFTFKPVYAADMPHSLPVKELLKGLGRNILKAVKYWLHYTLVAFAWLGVVPLTAYRIYKCLFAGSVSSLLTLPLDLLSLDNLVSDCLRGCFVVSCSISAFILLVWLREQIIIHGGPAWLNNGDNALPRINIPGVGMGLFAGGAQRDAEEAVNPDIGDGNVAQNNQVNGNEVNGNRADENHGDGQLNDAILRDDENNQPLAEDFHPEWERAAEDLTWERFLGLDGSLVFLEHVFWIISLNTSFILVFGFCPFHIGKFLLVSLSAEQKVTGTDFDGFVTAIMGYVVLATGLVACHGMCTVLSLSRLTRVLGFCYVVIKVSLLMVLEIGIFPLICGWWLDICSLPLFALTLNDRIASFYKAPGTAMFFHWLVGMFYVFYFASFVLLLREILRPGVLWFMRNLNDPDFHPVQEMIHLSVLRHTRRFLVSLVVFGTAILVMVWTPVQMIKTIFPGFLPFNIVLTSDAPVSELSFELLLLQVVLPALLEQGHTRSWLKKFVRGWVVAAAHVLNMRSYLLGDIELENNDPNVVHYPIPRQARNHRPVAEQNQNDNQQQAHPIHPAPLAAHNGVVMQPYIRPSSFTPKIVFLIVSMCFSLMLSSFVSMTVPIFIGRSLLALAFSQTPVHELYTAATGFYMLWLVARTLQVLAWWLPLEFAILKERVLHWLTVGFKLVTVAVLFGGVVPLLLGLLFDLVVVVPLRVPLHQTPLFFLWQDWALGILHLKIFCAVITIGPDWWLKRSLEQVYNNGIANIRLDFVLRSLAFPVVASLLSAIAFPYFIAYGVIPQLDLSSDIIAFCERRIYPFVLVVVLIFLALVVQGRQFRYLYEKIKNDKYLIGQRLVNYDHNGKKKSPNTKDVTNITQHNNDPDRGPGHEINDLL